MSAFGTSLHSRRCKSLDVIGCTADKQGQLALPASAAIDPKRTLIRASSKVLLAHTVQAA
jgi:hypothetical protein